MKKEKKNKKTLRQKLANGIIQKLQPYIKDYVKDHDKWLIEQIIHRIEFLSIQENFTIELLINDLRKGDFENDKKECI